LRASRRMDARTDSLPSFETRPSAAPQDEVVRFFTRSFAEQPLLGNFVMESFSPDKIDQRRHADVPRTLAGHAVVFGNSQFG
jgi:hypothetical protein